MPSVFRLSTKRILFGSLVAAVLLAGVAAIFIPRHNSSASPVAATTRVMAGKLYKGVVRSGQVTLANLPTTHSAAAPSRVKTTPTNRPLKSAAQTAAYRKHALANPNSLPSAVAAAAPQGTNLYHTGNLPVLQNKHAGLTSVDGGGWYPPDQAIATSPSYVFEGVNSAMAVYNSTTYALLSGPTTPDTFFASVMQSGSTFADPQVTFDASRQRYLIAWLEIATGGNDYVDIAMSTTSSPLGSWHVYQVDPRVAGSDDFCDYETLGYDWFGMYFTCITFSISSGGFLGNNTFAASLDNMASGTLGTFAYYGSINNAHGGAYRISPAIEDGVPQAEWIAASDAGSGVTSSNLTLCALTNTQALGTATAPTLSCKNNALPQTYDDPFDAAQPGTGAGVYTGTGFKQITYRSGKLYFALPEAVNCSGNSHDGIYWGSVTPQLSTLAAHNPQQVSGIASGATEIGVQCHGNADAYMPTLIASSESDLTLVYNYSSSSVYPSIVFTGRANTDALGTMGQGSSRFVVSGTHSNDSGRWGDYSACALTTNGGSRGIIYCGGEYGGPNTVLGGFGWDTYLYTIRME